MQKTLGPTVFEIQPPLKMGKNPFSAILTRFRPFFGVGHREEGTSRARILSNDTTPMSLGQLVQSVEVAQHLRTDRQMDRRTDRRTNIFLNMIFLLIGT